MEYYPAIARQSENAICSNMDEQGIKTLREVRNREISYDVTHPWSLDYGTWQTYLQDRNSLIYIEKRL